MGKITYEGSKSQGGGVGKPTVVDWESGLTVVERVSADEKRGEGGVKTEALGTR